MRVPIVVDRRGPAPLHRQIYEEWRRGILSTRFAPGDRLPSTRDLAAMLGISRTTATAAYDQLMAEGYIESERGSGTFVSRDLPDVHPRMTRAADDSSARSPVRLSKYGTRLEPASVRPTPAAGIIHLSNPVPDVADFPFPIWRRLLARQLRRVAPATLDYGSHGAGHDGLRQAIASYLARSRAVRCTPDQVVIVNGSQQALDVCARVLIDAGDDVAIEDPAYLGARQLFAAHGARLRPVPVLTDGLSVAALPGKARLVYVTPSHQFPLGVSMTLARRLELIAWARTRGAVIIEDDYDSEYRYDGAPLPALQGLTASVPVIYVGTFSNVMFPGLRLGYLVLPPDLVEPFTRAKWHADRHSATLEQAALADFIREGHLERHIRRMRRRYKRRREILVDALTRHFGRRVAILGDAAGMHLVVRFASPRPFAQARRNGVEMTSTAPCYVGAPPPAEFLIRFSALSERAIREAITRLG